MKELRKLSIMACTLMLVGACEHASTSEDEAVATNAILAEAVQGNSANVSIGLVNGAPKFVGEGSTICHPNGQCGVSSGISLTGISGDIDLSSFTAGDVAISISIGNDAANAGYRFPSDPYQAVGIAVFSNCNAQAPAPVFSQSSWPSAEFGAPSVSADLRTINFVDKDDDANCYEYSVALNGPGGRTVLDPRVKNGGGGNR